MVPSGGVSNCIECVPTAVSCECTWSTLFNDEGVQWECIVSAKWLFGISQFDIPASRLPNKAVNWLRLGLESRFSAPQGAAAN